jgi:type VI secretion system secreted protein VgrG
MPSPKSGKAGSAVEPAEPKAPQEADKADPGEVEKIKAEEKQKKSGKYGSAQVKPHKPPETEEEKAKKPSWIEIKLVDEDGEPVPGERYKVILPDGETTAEGTLDEKGFARVDGFEPGQCQVTFPDLDESVWEPK